MVGFDLHMLQFLGKKVYRTIPVIRIGLIQPRKRFLVDKEEIFMTRQRAVDIFFLR